MMIPRKAYPAATIRECEAPLLVAQEFDDQLMLEAAAAVAHVAEAMLQGTDKRVLLVVGTGGNGGDALYAGQMLIENGADVTAVIPGTPHTRALEQFTGEVFRYPDDLDPEFDLLIDGVAGLGAGRPLAPEVYELFLRCGCPVLAVDVPSGVNADTGEAADACVTADITVTFGGLRLAHALAPECGTVFVADIGETIDDEDTLGEYLEYSGEEELETFLAVNTHLEMQGVPALPPMPHTMVQRFEPQIHDNKYTNGVLAILAGSAQYPGAGILCTGAALNTNSGLTYYVGAGEPILRHYPEVVVRESVDKLKKVDAAVIGPGRGECAEELAQVLALDVPVVVDADALTALGSSDLLKQAVRKRTATTILTPHEGEFARLSDATGTAAERARALAEDLRCTVVLKGRITAVAEWSDGDVFVATVNAGCSWGAVPGSGDVLAGIIGASLAAVHAQYPGAPRELFTPLGPVCLHALAAYLSARTPAGPAPTRASKIVDAISLAIALQLQG